MVLRTTFWLILIISGDTITVLTRSLWDVLLSHHLLLLLAGFESYPRCLSGLTLLIMFVKQSKAKLNHRKRVIFVVVANICLVTQWINLVLLIVYHDQLEDFGHSQANKEILLSRNIMVSITAIVLSFYSAYYSWRLWRLLRLTPNVKLQLRTKIVMQAITIQVVLFLHVAGSWIERHQRSNHYWYDAPWFWPTF